MATTIKTVDTPINALLGVLREIASSFSVRCEVAPPELSQSVSRASDIATEMGVPLKPNQTTVKGEDGTGIYIDCHAIIIFTLSVTLSDHDTEAKVTFSQLIRQQKRAAIALTWLPPAMRSDLNLFIVAPPGAAESAEWGNFAAQTERNEQVCRKLVWLPPENSDKWYASAKSFCNRTFLARPWTTPNQPNNPAQLDPLSQLVNADDKTAKWLNIVEQSVDEDSELAEALLRAFVDNPQEATNVP